MMITNRWMGCVLFLALFPLCGRADDGGVRKPAPGVRGKSLDEKKPASDPYVAVGELSGRLTSWDENSQAMTLHVKYKYVVPNPDAYKILHDLQWQQMQASYNPNPVERHKKIMELQAKIEEQYTKLTMVKEETKDYHLHGAEDMIVRLPEPPLRFTNKGDPWPYTLKELQELRAKEPNLPGFAGTTENIKVNQQVTVLVYRKVGPPPPADPDAPKGKESGEKLYVRLLVVTAQPRE